MLFFGITLAVGVAAVLALQKLDVECLNPPASRPALSGARSAKVRLTKQPKPFVAFGKKARA